jgi:TRAP-type mannitol/chloroaromatic compound transport system substrate-binding protein
MTRLTRRSFIKTTSAGTIAASALSAPFVHAEGTSMTARMVTTWPRNFPALGTGAQRVADRITTMTNGRISIKVFAAGELVPPFEAFDVVSSGSAEMYHGAEYYWQGKNKAFNFFSTVPLGFTAKELQAWVYFGGGQQLWDELSDQYHIKAFLCGNTGVQMGGWFRNPIKSLDDMKGLKMRMPGLGGEVLRKLGASAVALPGSEIFPALQAGTIDATEWVGPYNDMAFGFHKILKNYMYPGFHETGVSLSLGLNKDWFQSLSEVDQKIIETVCSSENDIMLAEYNTRNGDALKKMIREDNINLIKMPDDVFNEIAKLSAEVVAEVAESGEIEKRVYESYTQFRNQVIRWTNTSDYAYLNARKIALGI